MKMQIAEKKMTQKEKLVFYATAKRATALRISQIVDGKSEDHWIGRLNGRFVGYRSRYKFPDKESAIQCARNIRQSCLARAVKMGLIPSNQN